MQVDVKSPGLAFGNKSASLTLPWGLSVDLTDDSVFAVKDKLVIDFKRVSKSYRAPEQDLQDKVVFELQQDFHLVKSVRKDDVQITGPTLGMSVEITRN